MDNEIKKMEKKEDKKEIKDVDKWCDVLKKI